MVYSSLNDHLGAIFYGEKSTIFSVSGDSDLKDDKEDAVGEVDVLQQP